MGWISRFKHRSTEPVKSLKLKLHTIKFIEMDSLDDKLYNTNIWLYRNAKIGVDMLDNDEYDINLAVDIKQDPQIVEKICMVLDNYLSYAGSAMSEELVVALIEVVKLLDTYEAKPNLLLARMIFKDCEQLLENDQDLVQLPPGEYSYLITSMTQIVNQFRNIDNEFAKALRRFDGNSIFWLEKIPHRIYKSVNELLGMNYAQCLCWKEQSLSVESGKSVYKDVKGSIEVGVDFARDREYTLNMKLSKNMQVDDLLLLRHALGLVIANMNLFLGIINSYDIDEPEAVAASNQQSEKIRLSRLIACYHTLDRYTDDIYYILDKYQANPGINLTELLFVISDMLRSCFKSSDKVLLQERLEYLAGLSYDLGDAVLNQRMAYYRQQSDKRAILYRGCYEKNSDIR